MHCLEIIRKLNDEYPKQSRKTGDFKFDKEAGCLVYDPSGVNNFKKEEKRTRKESVTQQ